MLNHAWTLLTNLTRSTVMPQHAWDLGGGPYVAVTPPDAVVQVRRRVFGASPDTAMLCYRSRQLLTLLAAGPLAPCLTDLDSRITCRFAGETIDRMGPFGVTVVAETDVSDTTVSVSGSPAELDAEGRIERSYLAEAENESSVTVTGLRPPGYAQTTALSITAERSNAIPLGDTGYQFYFQQLRAFDALRRWRLDTVIRPQQDVSAIVADVAALGEPVRLALFGYDRTEPYLSFRKAWETREAGLRAAAIAAAMIYRTNDRRLGRG